MNMFYSSHSSHSTPAPAGGARADTIGVPFGHRHCILMLCTLLVLMTVGCASTERIYEPVDENAGWYPTRVENELAGQDPIEGFNRTMFWVTDACMQYIGSPLASIYGSIMPKPAVESIENLCLLCEFPARLFSSLGSAEWKGSGDECLRFFINATVGIAGLFDPAENWFHIHSTDSDFGAMFASWGIGPGCTFMLPFVPSSNVRDTVGFLFDCAFDVKTYLPYTYLATFNRFIVRQQQIASLTDHSADHYKTMRTLLAVYRTAKNKRATYYRRYEINADGMALYNDDGTMKPYYLPPQPVIPASLQGNKIVQPEFISVSPVVDSLRSLQTEPVESRDFWFMKNTLFNGDFERKRDVHKIRRGDGNVDKYAFYPQKHEHAEGKPLPKQKLALLIPGIGSAFDSDGSTALAEVFYNAGYDVVVIDNPFYFRYLVDGPGRGVVPGYAPQDAIIIRKYFADILSDLKKDGRIFDVEKTVLAGWSIGAVYAAHLMSQESSDNTLNISHAILINPQVDPARATDTIDSYLAGSKKWSAADIRGMMPDLVAKMMIFIGSTRPEIDEDSKFDNLYAYYELVEPKLPDGIPEYLTGVSLRSNIRDVLFTLHGQSPLPQLKNNTKWMNRNALYNELDRITFADYQQRFLVSHLQKNGITDSLPVLKQKSSLHALENFLRNTDKVVLLHNYNDPLINDEDKIWLGEVFRNRAYWFNAGGHLGNWNLNRFRKTVLASVHDAMPEPSPEVKAEAKAEEESTPISWWGALQRYAYFWTFFVK